MDAVVVSGFSGAIDNLREEAGIMPMSRWNESVFRHCFCRSIAKACPEVGMFIECSKIDLVLSHETQRAFVEFKFYRHPKRFNPYAGGKEKGYKGGPGNKNHSEFASCIERLHGRTPAPGLSKYVVLVYIDPTDGSRPGQRYSPYYDDYRHLGAEVEMRNQLSSEPFETSEGVVKGRLYKIGSAIS